MTTIIEMCEEYHREAGARKAFTEYVHDNPEDVADKVNELVRAVRQAIDVGKVLGLTILLDEWKDAVDMEE